jgi:hypothetical protein
VPRRQVSALLRALNRATRGASTPKRAFMARLWHGLVRRGTPSDVWIREPRRSAQGSDQPELV